MAIVEYCPADSQWMRVHLTDMDGISNHENDQLCSPSFNFATITASPRQFGTFVLRPLECIDHDKLAKMSLYLMSHQGGPQSELIFNQDVAKVEVLNNLQDIECDVLEMTALEYLSRLRNNDLYSDAFENDCQQTLREDPSDYQHARQFDCMQRIDELAELGLERARGLQDLVSPPDTQPVSEIK